MSVKRFPIVLLDCSITWEGTSFSKSIVKNLLQSLCLLSSCLLLVTTGEAVGFPLRAANTVFPPHTLAHKTIFHLIQSQEKIKYAWMSLTSFLFSSLKNKNMPDWKYTIQKEKSLYFILQISHNKKICLIRLKTFDLHKLYDIYGKNFSSSQVCMQVSHGGYQKINRVGLHQTRISITSMTTRAVVGILVGSQTMDRLWNVRSQNLTGVSLSLN